MLFRFPYIRPLIHGDQKVSVNLTITVQLSGAHRLFDHPVILLTNLIVVCAWNKMFLGLSFAYLLQYI